MEISFHGKVIPSSICVAAHVSGGRTLFIEPPMTFPHEGLYTFQCADGRSGQFYLHGASATNRESVLLAGEQFE